MLKLIHSCIALIIALSLCLFTALIDSRIIFKDGIDWLGIIIIISTIFCMWLLFWMWLKRASKI